MIRVEDYLPKTIPEQVEELYRGVLRLSKGNRRLAGKRMLWLMKKDPLIAEAVFIWGENASQS